MNDADQKSMFELQEEAKKRVMDMRSRSRFAADRMNRELGDPAVNVSYAPQPAAGKPTPQEPLSSEELERMFILSLCLLLSHEGADRSVILGLMYLLT